MSARPTRRAVLTAGSITILARGPGWAQQSKQTFRIGILSVASHLGAAVGGVL
jgi:hypothetical protein